MNIENRDIGSIRYKYLDRNFNARIDTEVFNGQVWLTRRIEGNSDVTIDGIGFPPSAITGVINLLKSAAQVLGYETE